MTRRKSRPERRRDLIEAARRAMVAHGADAVHLNQVAQEAGLTSGAVLYHYPELTDLLLEAHQAGMERFYARRVAEAENIQDPVLRLVATIRSGLPDGPDDPDVRLLCELGGAAGRNRAYSVLLTTLYDRQVSLYEQILTAGAAAGAFRLSSGAQLIARNLVALEDAYGYRIVARHPTIDPGVAVELILDYARQATSNALVSS